MKRHILIIIFLLLGVCSQAQLTKQKEVYYQILFAKEINGKREVVLPDLARVDIVTDTFAIEVEFADNFYEGIGQSELYSIELNKKAGILLVVNGNTEDRFIKKLLTVAAKKDITVWLLDYNTNLWRRVKINYVFTY